MNEGTQLDKFEQLEEKSWLAYFKATAESSEGFKHGDEEISRYRLDRDRLAKLLQAGQ